MTSKLPKLDKKLSDLMEKYITDSEKEIKKVYQKSVEDICLKYDLYFRTGNGEFGFYKNINYEEIITSFTFPELSEIEEIKIFNKTESKLIHGMVQCMSFPLFDRQCYGSLLDNFG